MFSFLSFRHVVELGCGLGLTGIVACRTCGVRSYTFTDCHPQVLFLLAKNIETNLTHPSSPHALPDSRDRKMLRRIKRQLSLTTDKTDMSCAASGDHSCGAREDVELEVPSVLSPDKPDSSAAVEGSREEEEDEISISEDGEVQTAGAGMRLEVNEAHWQTDSKQMRAVLQTDPRVSVCQLDWEDTPPHVLSCLQADVILGAGRFLLRIFHSWLYIYLLYIMFFLFFFFFYQYTANPITPESTEVMFFFNLVSLNWIECSTVAACPSLICFFNKDPIEGTNFKKKNVWCLCIPVLFYVLLGL